ncbi:MAG: glycosyltransferase family 4 protein, partial [Bacteroidia bacterium]|nr:glycosyltransferase family 4 protein [Bacteroidia bacterium]
DDPVFYSSGKLISKIFILIRSAIKRWKDIKRSSEFDAVFIQREAFFTGTTFFEKQLKKKCGKMIFDFDDAIWNHDVSSANKTFGWLKNPEKTGKIISLCDLVIAGNEYLADYARKYNDNVIIIPTTIDTNEYASSIKNINRDKICIGWSGSITTIKHFQYAIPFLKKLRDHYGSKVEFKVIGDSSYKNSELQIRGIGWSKEKEISELSSFDIGIMPLPNDNWAKGKCGLKGLQYMALEIPTIMSPVGVNTDIIKDGINGFLADDTDEWIEKISRLIEDRELRNQIGSRARETVIEKYSVDSQEENYKNAITSIL